MITLQKTQFRPKAILTVLSLFLLIGCSSKEDKLWENRLMDLEGANIATVASVDLQVGQFLSALDTTNIYKDASRDLNIYLHGKPNQAKIDTTALIQDSIVPQMMWQKLTPFMVNFFVNKPYEKITNAWSLEAGKSKSKAHLQTLLIKSEEFYQDPENPLKEILSQYSFQDNEVKIPVGAFLVRINKEYAWIICSKWNLSLLKTDFLDHFEGVAYSVKTKKELGRFYHQPKPQISDSLATITEQQEPLHNLVLE